MRLAILMTCHNRKESTIVCLESLFNNELPVNFNIDVFLVDDGSTDGTTAAVNTAFPNVIVIKSSGDLFWNRGMRLAWKTASAKEDFDFYLWLNDDLELKNDSFEIIFNDYNKLNNDKSILSGVCASKDNLITYGGYSLGSKQRILPNGNIQECDFFNGNFVLVPRSVFSEIGMLDKIFHHAKGDFDYGLRAKQNGIKSYITSNIIGYCERHEDLPVWCNRNVSLSKRINAFYSPLGIDPYRTFIFKKRHYGFLISVYHLIIIHVRLFLPSIWVWLKKDTYL